MKLSIRPPRTEIRCIVVRLIHAKHGLEAAKGFRDYFINNKLNKSETFGPFYHK